ncbi:MULTISPECIES: intimin-like inverse autotransporter SinH [Escherichia]|uniref:intimin-like inverse autotransporter SinH n=1 Tax=Escherichia TaxID=561 RepID=UPI0002B9382B|nr:MULTISPECIES: intimin-like inverse autotransporter SinH [Escherichia]EFB2837962.1 intimin-like inverse autotransporter SinH [Escherichia coli]EFJ2712516.1 intimin-like inverse autotransporter SinH [Escherichia coli]EHS3894632.1 intimin-like inverse autotransporter SinH [Escherichia coli]EHS4055705.1 intimin-like inverse autotransporter SinH [Escherichia coli]EHW6095027.1 intimin-like inverse autotransporter SinH [Escherichia coli]
MLRWIRYFMLIFISGAAYATPEINVKQSDSSLPDLGSEAALQEEQNNKGKSLKERGVNYVAESAQQGFENLTPEALESQARSYLQGQITSSAQSYIEGALSPYGKVRSNLSIGQDGSLDGSSIDYFVPLYDSQKSVYFSQLSAQRKEERTIGNIGFGVRHNFDKWLLGGNIFYDYDFTRGHRRLGLGTEAWTDYLKLSGNYYHPLSDWKDSKDFDFYLERPARGWDVRAEAWLPSYPQLGGKVVFEQYYGDEVALFGTDNLEKDPYAVTLGVNYQPVPLLTVGADYKAGTGDNSDLSVNATINYQFGVPLKDQLNSDNVKVAHSLMGSRHDFVERNNFIVLEYKEKDPLDVTLWLKADATNEHPECVIKDTPEEAVGLEKCKWTINALINHHYKIISASWQAKNNAARTLVMPVVKANTITEGNNNHWNLVLPAWQYSSDKAEQEKLNTWRVRLALEDEKGNRQNSGVVEITVQQDRKIELIVNNIADVPEENNHSHEASAQADGVDGVVMDLDVTDSFGDDTDRNGNTLPEDNLSPQLYDAQDKKVTLTNKPCSTENPCVFIAKQDKEKGTVTLSSTLPGTFRWKAKAAPYDDSNYVDVTFLGAGGNDVNAFIYRVSATNPVNLIDNEKEHLPVDNAYRFVLWRDANKDGVFQQSEKLTEEEMTQYDYQWEFTGQSVNGYTGAQTNTSNEDIVIPATNEEAVQKFGAQKQDGVQGYGLRVVYSKH